jgi:MFS family permease
MRIEQVEAAELPRRRWFALFTLLLGAFLPVLDFNVVYLALPSIQADLHASPSEIEFILNAYATTYGVLQITGGRLGDRFGRKRMFIAGLLGFTIASLLCAAAWTPEILIGGRILQAATASWMAPQVIASIRHLFSPAEQRIALAFYASTFGLAFVTGQLVGGFVVQMKLFGLTWQPIFLLNVPIGLAAAIGALRVMKEERHSHTTRLDVGGVLLCSAALFSLIYPLTAGREAGWPPWMFLQLAAFPIIFGLFVAYELRQECRGRAPLIQFGLLRRPTMALGVPIAICFYSTSGLFLTISVYLQEGLKLSPAQAGMSILPLSVAYFVMSLFSAAIGRRLGSYALPAGLLLKLMGLLVVAAAAEAQSLAELKTGLALIGCGYGMIMPTLIGTVVQGVDTHHAGLAAGVVTSSLQIGFSLGVAIVGGIFFGVLGGDLSAAAYAHAFSIAVLSNAVLIAIAGVLALTLARQSIRSALA